jgi:hypothetical protein
LLSAPLLSSAYDDEYIVVLFWYLSEVIRTSNLQVTGMSIVLAAERTRVSMFAKAAGYSNCLLQ